MAQHENCVKYPCEWHKSVGYCPERCNHFRHKDEVVVTRCMHCVKGKFPDDLYLVGSYVVCDKFGCLMRSQDFCSYGDRKDGR